MRNKIILTIACAFLPLSLLAQTQATETGYDFRSRTSASVDWKICKGLDLSGGYELRTADKFSRIERHQATIGINWSPIKYLDVGGGYTFIGHYDSDKTFKPRHRVFLDLGGGYKFGVWKLSLKERLMLTHKSYEINEYQQVPNLLELKSRLKVTYKGFTHLEPYAYAELRNCFNAPSFSYEYNETKKKYTNYQFLGYSDAYINRIRAAIGLEWNIDRHNCIDFRFMNDWCSDKNIDTNAEGTKLKSYTWEKNIVSSIVVGYVFSF